MIKKQLIKKYFNKFYTKGLISTQMIEEPGRYFTKNSSQLSSLHNKYAGERCFIIGNGPSLNMNDLSLLKNEYTFGVNSIFYMSEKNGFKPTFYVVEDGHVINDNINEISEYDVEYKFLPAVERKKFASDLNAIFLNMNRGFYEPLSPNFNMPRFSRLADKVVYCGQSVTIVNLQLAYFMGFSEVYMIGMDFSYQIPDSAQVNGKDILSTEDDCNHFDPRYFGKGKKWHDPKLDNVLASYIHCKNMFENDGRKIINSTVGGKLEIFERKDYVSLF